VDFCAGARQAPFEVRICTTQSATRLNPIRTLAPNDAHQDSPHSAARLDPVGPRTRLVPHLSSTRDAPSPDSIRSMARLAPQHATTRDALCSNPRRDVSHGCPHPCSTMPALWPTQNAPHSNPSRTWFRVGADHGSGHSQRIHSELTGCGLSGAPGSSSVYPRLRRQTTCLLLVDIVFLGRRGVLRDEFRWVVGAVWLVVRAQVARRGTSGRKKTRRGIHAASPEKHYTALSSGSGRVCKDLRPARRDTRPARA